jgi:hypothetical protein
MNSKKISDISKVRNLSEISLFLYINYNDFKFEILCTYKVG